jgi:Rrf2 family nitric oxide-sensitive transcriptional repressor
MQLTRFTDLGLRVLMYLSGPERTQAVTVAEIAERFQVSQHHLTKVVQFLAQQAWVRTSRGKGGGLSLAQMPEQYRLGEVIRQLEGHSVLIDCAQPPCVLRGECGLQNLLTQALDGFYAALDRYTLADTLAGPTHQAIITLHRLSPRSA